MPSDRLPRDGGVRPSETRTEMTWIVMPGQTNALGTVFGGQVMAWIDVCAAVSAQRFARCTVVTAGMDSLNFRAPMRQGNIAVLRASVNWAGHSSMEVGVRVEREDAITGERTHTSSAYLTFVALDSRGNKVRLPTLSPETDEEIRRHHEAEMRREARLRHKEDVKNRRAAR